MLASTEKYSFDSTEIFFCISNEANAVVVKAMVFPVVMHGCESWTIKKAEHGSIDAFELWY